VAQRKLPEIAIRVSRKIRSSFLKLQSVSHKIRPSLDAFLPGFTTIFSMQINVFNFMERFGIWKIMKMSVYHRICIVYAAIVKSVSGIQMNC
jgi:hypothetical protein